MPNGLVATSESSVGLVSEQGERSAAKVVFEGPHDVERWDVRGRRGDLAVEKFVYTAIEPEETEESTTSSGGLDERFVMLAVEREGATFVVDGKWEFRDGKPRVVAYLGYPGNYGMIPRTLLPKEHGGDGDGNR